MERILLSALYLRRAGLLDLEDIRYIMWLFSFLRSTESVHHRTMPYGTAKTDTVSRCTVRCNAKLQ
jgi:hypothetical protein